MTDRTEQDYLWEEILVMGLSLLTAANEDRWDDVLEIESAFQSSVVEFLSREESGDPEYLFGKINHLMEQHDHLLTMSQIAMKETEEALMVLSKQKQTSRVYQQVRRGK